MRRYSESLLPFVAVAIALLMMLPAWDAGPLVLDEHVAYWLSAPDVPLPIWERSVRYAAAPPLTSWFQAIAMSLFGETELAIRLPSLLGYLFGVAVIAFGCRMSLGRLAAGLAACALALHPDVVDEVRVGRMYGLVVLWTSILVAMTLQWGAAPRRYWHGIAWGVVAAAAAWTHILTLPVIGLSAAILGIQDMRKYRTLQPATLLGGIVVGLLSLPLVPMLERIWQWRHTLNYQTGSVSVWTALGPFLWFALASTALVMAGEACLRRIPLRSNTPQSQSLKEPSTSTTHSAMWMAALLGLLPLVVIGVAGQGDFSSLGNPRYRIPMAAANACLLGLLCTRNGRTLRPLCTCAFALFLTWMIVGRLPTDLQRLDTSQATVWKQLAESLAQTVREKHLETVPVFVQSGLIEGTMISAFPDDLLFHGYVSSRLGRFYARTPNPRLALPMSGGGDNGPMAMFYHQKLSETVAQSPSDLFVAVARDTDVNRRCFEEFLKLLAEYGYKGTPLTGHETWGVLYHFQRPQSLVPE